jgi:hypothetical protein
VTLGPLCLCLCPCAHAYDYLCCAVPVSWQDLEDRFVMAPVAETFGNRGIIFANGHEAAVRACMQWGGTTTPRGPSWIASIPSQRPASLPPVCVCVCVCARVRACPCRPTGA